MVEVEGSAAICSRTIQINQHVARLGVLLGNDGEGTVDSSHPNDLGFMRQADAFAKVLGPLLTKAAR